MRVTGRDWFATGMVALAALMAALWAMDATLPGLEGVRATGVVVMVCGLMASVGAVVPGFDWLIHGNRVYLVIASLLGVLALGAGVGLFLSGDSWWMWVLVAVTIVLWAIATIRHAGVAWGEQRPAPVLEEKPRQPVAL